MTIFQEKQRHANISISASGDNTIISAIAGAIIVIDHINFLPTSAVTVTLKDGASTELNGGYPLDAKQAVTLENPSDWHEGVLTMSSGNAFIMNLGNAVAVNGFVRYRVIGA